MYSKADFQAVIESNIEKYPALAVHFKAGDPKVTQPLLAIAEMASMLSQQIEISSNEPFEKARDTTVLADAALKGILPKAIPSESVLSVTNENETEITIGAGRKFLDSSGYPHEAVESITIPAESVAELNVIQRVTRTINHTVSESAPFYKVEITNPESGRFISGIHVADTNGNTYKYHYRYTNIEPNEKGFHVEVDEYRRLFVVFGHEDIVGYQPATNEQLIISVYETNGDIDLKAGSPFSFDYTYSPTDAKVSLSMSLLSVRGENPHSISTLREITNYPSIYDDNAAYLGEFDRLIRRHLGGGLTFLSVWNEQIEEQFRAPNIDNIKRLFFSFSTDSDASTKEQEIRDVIAYADDSYRITHVTFIESSITVTVNADIARVYKPDDVKSQIKTLLLEGYGKGSTYSKKGLSIPTNEQVREILRSNIIALQDSGSDFTVEVSNEELLPEHWHFLTGENIVINIASSNHTLSQWGR